MECLLERHMRELRFRRGYTSLGVVSRRVVLLLYREVWLEVLLGPLKVGGWEVEIIRVSIWDQVRRLLKASWWGGVLCNHRVFVYQVGRFLGPGQSQGEKERFKVVCRLSVVCGVLGSMRWWLLLLPRVCNFGLDWALRVGLVYVPEVVRYVDLVLGTWLASLVGFQGVPLVVGGILAGVWRVKRLGQCRRFVYLGMLLGATVLSPPDVGSQVLLAVPLIVCFEVGLVLGSMLER